MGVAYHGEGPILRSMLGLGFPFASDATADSFEKALERRNETGHRLGRTERYASVAAPQRVLVSRTSTCNLPAISTNSTISSRRLRPRTRGCYRIGGLTEPHRPFGL